MSRTAADGAWGGVGLGARQHRAAPGIVREFEKGRVGSQKECFIWCDDFSRTERRALSVARAAQSGVVPPGLLPSHCIARKPLALDIISSSLMPPGNWLAATALWLSGGRGVEKAIADRARVADFVQLSGSVIGTKIGLVSQSVFRRVLQVRADKPVKSEKHAFFLIDACTLV